MPARGQLFHQRSLQHPVDVLSARSQTGIEDSSCTLLKAEKISTERNMMFWIKNWDPLKSGYKITPS